MSAKPPRTEYRVALYVMAVSADRPFMGETRVYEGMHDCERISEVVEVRFALREDAATLIGAILAKRRRALTDELSKLDLPEDAAIPTLRGAQS